MDEVEDCRMRGVVLSRYSGGEYRFYGGLRGERGFV